MKFLSSLLSILLCASNTVVVDASSEGDATTSNNNNHLYLRGGTWKQRHRRRTNEALMKRVIVTYEPGHGDDCLSSIKSMAPSLVMEHELEPQHAFVLMGTAEDIDLLQTSSAQYVLDVEEDVPRHPFLLHQEEWTVVAPKMAAGVTSTTLADDDLPYGISLVQAPDLWQYGVRGQGVTVCVIDSGVDGSHEDLSDLSGYSGQSNLEWNEDVIGHGTHVTGTRYTIREP